MPTKTVTDEGPSVEALLPARPTLGTLRAAAAGCRACPLGAPATQTVFGEGPTSASIVLVGEQPGDVEDREGHPFVGPAGDVLDRALRDAKIDRGSLYLTNAVKHFGFEPRGKRRLHKKPKAAYVAVCHPWLEAELAVIAPKVVVCLGATAAQSFLGAKFAITKSRGQVLAAAGRALVATFHPSAILRMPDHDAREATYRALVADLVLAKKTADEA